MTRNSHVSLIIRRKKHRENNNNRSRLRDSLPPPAYTHTHNTLRQNSPTATAHHQSHHHYYFAILCTNNFLSDFHHRNWFLITTIAYYSRNTVYYTYRDLVPLVFHLLSLCTQFSLFVVCAIFVDFICLVPISCVAPTKGSSCCAHFFFALWSFGFACGQRRECVNIYSEKYK